MAKEDIRKVLGVTAAVFAQMGSIDPEQARAMSGLDAAAFDEAMLKAAKAAEEVKAAAHGKEPGFFDIVAHAAQDYMDGHR